MAFRSIGEITAKMSAKTLDKRPFQLKQNENTDMVMSEPAGASTPVPALTATLSERDKRHGC